MGAFSKLKELVGIEEMEDDEDEVEEEVEKKPILPRPSQPAATPARPSAPATSNNAKTPQGSSRYTSAQKIVVIEPQGFDESPKLVDSLKAKKPVIINLENLETDTARKIFDFLSGATYALNGNVQKVANNIFVFAPENVSVDYKNSQTASEKAAEGYKSPWR